MVYNQLNWFFCHLTQHEQHTAYGQGVTRRLKAFYRHSLIKCFIASIDQGKSPRNINILEAMVLLTASWDRVSSETLVNFFRKAGISYDSQFQSRSDDDDPFNLLAERVDELKENSDTFSPPVDFTVLYEVVLMIKNQQNYITDCFKQILVLNCKRF